MALLGLFYPPWGLHPGYTESMQSPNVFGNGIPVLINPYWVCLHEEPPHPPGLMNPQSDMFGVFFNGVGAGLVSMSVSPCGATIDYGSFNINVG